jgi:hypothetical protein
LLDQQRKEEQMLNLKRIEGNIGVFKEKKERLHEREDA